MKKLLVSLLLVLTGCQIEPSFQGRSMTAWRKELKGVKLKPGKGLNFPDTQINLEPLTDKDRDDLDLIAKHADMIGHSFVESADQCAAANERCAKPDPFFLRKSHNLNCEGQPPAF